MLDFGNHLRLHFDTIKQISDQPVVILSSTFYPQIKWQLEVFKSL